MRRKHPLTALDEASFVNACEYFVQSRCANRTNKLMGNDAIWARYAVLELLIPHCDAEVIHARRRSRSDAA